MTPLDYQSPNTPVPSQSGFLRSLFGPSKKEVWQQLADQIGARYEAGGFLGQDRVVARTDQWTVTLDTFTVSNGENGSTTYTRLRAPYVNKDGFRFTVYRAGFFTAVGEMLGLRDIRVGDDAFDQAFVVKSVDENKVRQLLADPQIRGLMAAQPRIRIEVKDDEGWFGTHFPQGVDELYFAAVGVIKDVELLHALFDLFSAILHRLCQIGSAYENDPVVAL